MNISRLAARARVFAVLACCLLALKCGGGSTPTPTKPSTPSTPSTPTTPAPVTPTNTWSAEGKSTARATPQGVPAATLPPAWGLAAVTADTQGGYQLGDVANPPST